MTSLAPRLLVLLAQTRITPGRITLRGRELTADSRGELEQALATHLYTTFHTGLQATMAGKAHFKQSRWLEQELTAVIPHTTTPVTAFARENRGEHIFVEWDGVLVRAPRDLAVDTPDPGMPVRLLVPPARPGLSPGFLFVTGSRVPVFTGAPLRVYVHLTDPAKAAAPWQAVLGSLERAGIGYQAKVLTRAAEYPRRDAMVVYLPAEEADAARLVADAVRGLPGIGEATSLFAEEIAPGVAQAWEPIDTRFGLSGLSFGLHRSRVLAKALLDGGEHPEAAVYQAFVAAGINPRNPALNTDEG
ncbi:T3SS effector HopA1 family protein [Amycolatopsis sp. NPDC059021]|uniref:T3SS effector HopA1 family protein n=1 Tax=Amycolatopsis sp. NPDC059021 TaxID=3346704 RepID=UPI00366B86C9